LPVAGGDTAQAGGRVWRQMVAVTFFAHYSAYCGIVSVSPSFSADRCA
jgi:hypothetical protein